MPDLPEEPRAPLRGHDLVREGNPVAGEPTETEAGSDAPRDRGNGAKPKEQYDVDMDETIASTTAPRDTALDDADTDTDQSAAGRIGGATGTNRVPAEQDGAGRSVVVGDNGGGRTSGDGQEVERPDGDGDGDGGDDSDARADEPAKKRRRPLRTAVEWVFVIGGALVVALVIRTFLLQAFWIPTASMEPTLQEGDRVLVNKLSYDLHDVNRGDVIVFERPEEPGANAHPEDDIKDLIKRVVGLPGETIEGRDGVVYINGRRLDEPYLPEGTTTNDLDRERIPEGHVFVMGDNRGNSSDSRVFGPIDEELIVGRAFVRIYPLGDIGGL